MFLHRGKFLVLVWRMFIQNLICKSFCNDELSRGYANIPRAGLQILFLLHVQRTCCFVRKIYPLGSPTWLEEKMKWMKNRRIKIGKKLVSLAALWGTRFFVLVLGWISFRGYTSDSRNYVLYHRKPGVYIRRCVFYPCRVLLYFMTADIFIARDI